MTKGIKKIFSEVPHTYERVNHVLTFGMDMLWRRRAAGIAVEHGGTQWLDMCSGTGETATYLARRAADGTMIVACDFCPPMIRMLKTKPEGSRISAVAAEAASLPFSDDTFDVITMSFATRNLNVSREALIKSLREYGRVLKPGGRFINLETSQPRAAFVKYLLHAYVALAVRPIGSALSGSSAAYAYLSHTIPRFYNAEEFAFILREAGFARVTWQPMFLGIAAIHTAEKS